MASRTISSTQQHAIVSEIHRKGGPPRRSNRKKVSRAPTPGAEAVPGGGIKKKRVTSMRSNSSSTTTSSVSSGSRRRRVSFELTDDHPRSSQPHITPAKLLLIHAKRAVALSKTSIMDVILDARSPNPSTHASERGGSLLEALDLYRQHRVPVPDARGYVFKDLASLDVYWQQQGAFLRGVQGCEEEDWSKLITLANVSAERSTVGWDEDSGTERSF